ncbi:MAG: lycopene cyclase domain-containing protein [Cyclobacteriaceae bacterium]|nr:lycopene cyclase domain-containing protein [Cyclobacteriaceae bacterium]
MNSHWLYTLIDIGSVLFPLLFSFYPKARFASKWKYAAPAIVIPALLFIVWDEFFTRMGVWGFNPRYLTGVMVGHLPIEEIGFFLCIPYACLFTYEAVGYFSKYPIDAARAQRPGYVLVAGLLLTGLRHYDKWYTSVTFIALAAYLLFLLLVVRPSWLGKFFFAFLFILIPFFLVNGILTGTGIPEEVVWYDNNENLGIRMGTIPFEDTFYGMLLIVMNVSIFEYLQQRDQRSVAAIRP